MRNKFTQQGSDVQGDDEDAGEVDRSQGATRAISSYIDPGLCWDDVPWLKSITRMRVLLKGVQCGEDAVAAYRAGLAGCVLSNHGGRQLDTCRVHHRVRGPRARKEIPANLGRQYGNEE